MKSSKFLDDNGIEPKEVVLASKKLGEKDAVAMAKAASRIVVAKGKNVTEFKPGGKVSSALITAMLGPTGNLRAPCLKIGKTVIVGFNDDVYADVFG